MEKKSEKPLYEYAVEVNDLTFGYSGFTVGKEQLKNVNLQLKPGSRCILSGDNGAGKTTLLRILGGKHMHPEGAVKVLGRRADFDRELNHERRFISSYWAQKSMAFTAYRVPLEADIAVHDMSADLQKEFPERRDELLEVLDVNLNWRMHKVSDGQRRRVQLFISLLRPFSVLLLDEVTTDLDVVTRADFLNYLKKECTERAATIVYATHIFEGLEDWATDLVYMYGGNVTVNDKLESIPGIVSLRNAGTSSPLMKYVESMIRADRTFARENDLDPAALSRKSKGARDNIPDGSAGGYAPGRASRFYNYYG